MEKIDILSGAHALTHVFMGDDQRALFRKASIAIGVVIMPVGVDQNTQGLRPEAVNLARMASLAPATPESMASFPSGRGEHARCCRQARRSAEAPRLT